MDELADCISSDENVEDICDAKELGEIISRFLRTQKQRDRIVFIRRYWYYDSVQEISEKYLLSESSVKQILFRMREKLRKFLEKESL